MTYYTRCVTFHLGRPNRPQEVRTAVRGRRLGVGTLACPACDAPVLPPGPVSPRDTLSCPFCAHGASVRDFLSLSAPSRPARVEVRVVASRL
jgi:hypothetical protein